MNSTPARPPSSRPLTVGERDDFEALRQAAETVHVQLPAQAQTVAEVEELVGVALSVANIHAFADLDLDYDRAIGNKSRLDYWHRNGGKYGVVKDLIRVPSRWYVVWAGSSVGVYQGWCVSPFPT